MLVNLRQLPTWNHIIKCTASHSRRSVWPDLITCQCHSLPFAIIDPRQVQIWLCLALAYTRQGNLQLRQQAYGKCMFPFQRLYNIYIYVFRIKRLVCCVSNFGPPSANWYKGGTVLHCVIIDVLYLYDCVIYSWTKHQDFIQAILWRLSHVHPSMNWGEGLQPVCPTPAQVEDMALAISTMKRSVELYGRLGMEHWGTSGNIRVRSWQTALQ